MTGLSKGADGSVLDCFISLRKLRLKNSGVGLERGSKGFVSVGEDDEIKRLFEKFVAVFLKEICAGRCIRSLPPMLGNGQSVDLFNLYSVVRENGGYEAVSENGLWVSVAKEFGFDSAVASALKLVYFKYLHTLDKWMLETVKDVGLKGGVEDSEKTQSVCMMDLESVSKNLSSESSDHEKKEGEHLHFDLEDKNGGEVRRSVGVDEEAKKNCSYKQFNSSVLGECGLSLNKCKYGEVESVVQLDGNKDNDKRISHVDAHVTDLKSVVKEHGGNRKRKRECDSSLLDWVRGVAKDPCDPSLGVLPERSKWNSFGNGHQWKQVLLARKAMSVKRNPDSSREQSIWQTKLRMHPTMYDDHSGSEVSRFSRRLRTAKESKTVERACSESSSSGNQRDLEDPIDKKSDSRSKKKRKITPLGPNFQAHVPEWTGEKHESDPKWLGKRVWPQEKGVNCNKLIERDRIGSGRHDLCGCERRGSFKCVKFHVNEKRSKLQLELGTAFNDWHIHMMGEGIARSWVEADEEKFESTVKSNPISQVKRLWDEMCKAFPNKKREDLVSYYFNVFLLRRRGQQNRSTSVEIDSDDDVQEPASTTNCVGSIYCSPKKTHLNFREHSQAK